MQFLAHADRKEGQRSSRGGDCGMSVFNLKQLIYCLLMPITS
jgi:hypothetical protein